MSFRRFLGQAGLVAAATAFVPAALANQAEVTAAPEPAAAEVATLADDSTPAAPGNAEAGQGKAAVCAACHGLDGNSADPQYPKLAGQHERYTARHLRLFKSGERENAIMLGFAATLSRQDMRDIGAYYATQKVRAGVADESLIDSGEHAGQPYYKVGEQLYRGGDLERGIPACTACHGPAGGGNPGPAYPLLAGQHAGYTATQLKAFRAGTVYGRGDNANLVMAGVAGALTDEEIQALATYIEGLHRAE
jgi:cytochrome c553